jgi:CHAT domain-containing protein
LLAKRAELLQRIRIEDPRWRSLSEPVPFDLRGVLDLLAERQQAALSLYYRPDQVVAVLLWDGRCAAECLHLEDQVRNGLSAYLANLELKNPKIETIDPVNSGVKAGDLVPPDLLNQALEATNLVVVPHGPLHLLPWAGLSHNGQRLFQHCPVGILPNLSCLPALTTAFASAPRIALFGSPDYSQFPLVEPLRYGKGELNILQEIYQSHGSVIVAKPQMGKDATEAKFWELARNPDGAGAILHVCCHGNFEAGEPMHSGLLVTDGRIDAAEITRTNLPYDEVVLSACHTGHRPTEVAGINLTGDDILGLPGAFLEAGTRSLLVSIPPAREDVTMDFMTLYHERRVTGTTPLAALQYAQTEMLSGSRYPPCLWVGFTVYGYQ